MNALKLKPFKLKTLKGKRETRAGGGDDPNGGEDDPNGGGTPDPGGEDDTGSGDDSSGGGAFDGEQIISGGCSSSGAGSPLMVLFFAFLVLGLRPKVNRYGVKAK